MVRLAVNFAAAHPDEIQERIERDEQAAIRAREQAERRKRLVAS